MVDSAGGGWSLGESAALELDVALSFACAPSPPAGKGRVLQSIWDLVTPAERRAYWGILGETRPFHATLEVLAILSGSLTEADYDAATLAMRSLTPEAALATMSAPSGEGPAAPASLGEAYASFVVDLYAALGFTEESLEGTRSQARREAEAALPLLAGGLRHEAFWQWLDRFYHRSYAPWRQGLSPALEQARSRAQSALGGPESPAGQPDLSWLPPENALHRRPELARALSTGIKAFFWLDPFGAADLWSVAPGLLVVSTAPPGPLYEAYRLRLDRIAARAAALGDPNRLAILRMIRQVGVTNTAMAAWLGLSRPTVSVHAKILREAGLVRSRREGRETRHEVVPGEVEALFRDLAEFLDLARPPKEGEA